MLRTIIILLYTIYVLYFPDKLFYYCTIIIIITVESKNETRNTSEMLSTDNYVYKEEQTRIGKIKLVFKKKKKNDYSLQLLNST